MSSTAVTSGSLGSRFAKLEAHAEKNKLPMHRYLSHSGKSNMYTYKEGAGTVPVPTGTEFLLNIEEMGHSWVCWKEGKPVDAINQLIVSGDELPAEEELPDHGPYEHKPGQSPDGWSRQYTFPMKGVKDGVEYIYKTGSPSSYRAMGRFLSALVLESKQHGDDETPIVAIETGSYIAGNGSKVTHPVLKIKGWQKGPQKWVYKFSVDAAANTTEAAVGTSAQKSLIDRRGATDADVA